MNGLPFPESDGVPYYNNPDAVGNLAMPNELYVRNASGVFTPVSSANPLATADAATLAKLADILAKLSADPATQATLEAARVLLNTIAGKDFATQTTLAAILNKLIAAPATEAKQTALNALIGEVSTSPTENTVQARLKALEGKVDTIIDGTSPVSVQLTGSFLVVDSAPVAGAKTVTPAAASIFAGGSRLANRVGMLVLNEGTLPIYWGPSGVTTATGYPVMPGSEIVFSFLPTVATDIYFIASANNVARVVEYA